MWCTNGALVEGCYLAALVGKLGKEGGAGEALRCSVIMLHGHQTFGATLRLDNLRRCCTRGARLTPRVS